MTLPDLLQDMHDQPEWYRDAVCAQTDPEAFFPEKGGSTRDGKRICLGCEVKDQCLAYALEHEERFGIWGGLSERERRQYAERVLGRKPRGPILTPDQRLAVAARLRAGERIVDIARDLNVHYDIVRKVRLRYVDTQGEAA